MAFREDRLDEYEQLLEQFRWNRRIETLIDALRLVPGVVREVVESEVEGFRASIEKLTRGFEGLRASIEKLQGELADLRKSYEELADGLKSVSEQLGEVNRRLSKIEVDVGGLAEAVIARFFLDDLRRQGYEVKEWERNYRLDDEDVDLLVVAERDGREEHFLVEVKVRPRHSDVGGLLAKAEFYEARRGVRPTPVLAGVWVGGEVEAYARKRGVMVVKL